MNLKPYAKAIVAFVLGVVTNMIADLLNGNAPWPQSGAEWVRYLISVVGVTAGVYGVPNQITQKQIDKSKDVVADAVLPEVAKEASTAAQAAVVEATRDIPIGGEIVADVTHHVGSVVDEVIRNYQRSSKPPP